MRMNPQWLEIIGLFIALAGAVTFAFGLIISRKQALWVGVARMAEDSDEKNICLPHVRDRLRESKYALAGVILLTIGFLLQIVGNWPRP